MAFLTNDGVRRLWSHILLKLGDKLSKTDAPGYADILTKTDAAELYAEKSGVASINDNVVTENNTWSAAKIDGLIGDIGAALDEI